MFFYKYRKPGILDFNMLRRGEIYFASAAELNDANECRPRFILNGSQELWQRLAEFVLQDVCFDPKYYRVENADEIRQIVALSQSVGKRLKKQVRNRDLGIESFGELFIRALGPSLEEALPQLQTRLITQLAKHFIDEKLHKILEEPTYIVSFSKNPTNPTMWGHYAAAERGFVIVYGTDDRTLHVKSPIHVLHGTRPQKDNPGCEEVGIYKEESLELFDVAYARRPPKANAFHRLIPKFSYTEREDHYDVPLLLPGDAPDKEERNNGLVKYSEWRYEQEIRAFFPTFGKLLPEIRTLTVSMDNVRGLIFGPQMSLVDKHRAVHCCYLMRESVPKDDSMTAFGFFQAKRVVNRFGVEILPLGILESRNFGYRPPYKPLRELDKPIVDKLLSMAEMMSCKNTDRTSKT
jgi:hypothetical protein